MELRVRILRGFREVLKRSNPVLYFVRGGSEKLSSPMLPGHPTFSSIGELNHCPDELYHVTDKRNAFLNRMRLTCSVSNPEVTLVGAMGSGTASSGRRPSKPRPHLLQSTPLTLGDYNGTVGAVCANDIAILNLCTTTLFIKLLSF